MQIIGQIVDVASAVEDGRSYIKIYLKTGGDGDIILTDRDFSPYFYAIPEEGMLDKLKKRIGELEIDEEGEKIRILRTEVVKRTDKGKEVEMLKVYTRMSSHVVKVKDSIKGFEELKAKREFEIPFYKRYLIDKDIKPFEWLQFGCESVNGSYILKKIRKIDLDKELDLKTLAFDIETYKDKVIMVSLFSNKFRQVITTHRFEKPQDFVKFVSNENELINEFVKVIRDQDPDIIVGYNTDAFDFQILRTRAHTLKVDLNIGRGSGEVFFVRRGRYFAAHINGRLHIDLFPFIQNIVSRSLKSDVLTLEKVSMELLGEGKHTMNWEDIRKSWERKVDIDKLADYALRDSEITYKLAKRLVPQIIALTKIIGLLPFDVARITYGQLVENYLMRQAFKRNIVIPNRPTLEKIRKRRSQAPYEGGFVKEPKEGVYENLAMFDYRSLYPSIIVAHNISYDTLNCTCCPENKVPGLSYNFCSKKKGFVPSVLEEIIKERFKLKDEMKKLKNKKDRKKYQDLYVAQNSLKYLINASYGYFAYAGARWYCRECAESITAYGRDYIKKTIEMAEKDKFEVIYSDTDSILLKSDNIGKKAPKFLEKVNKTLPKYMELEFEGFYPRGIFTFTKEGRGAKKKYALLDDEGVIKITGFEKVRRDWSILSKETQEKVIELVLLGKPDEAIREVNKTISQLRRKEIPLEKLIIYTQLNKPVNQYDVAAPHVEAAKKAIERGVDISVGQTIRYIITDREGRISDKAELYRFAEDYDSNYYIENQILPAALRVLKVLGYSKDNFLFKGRQTSLSKFGGEYDKRSA